MLNNTLMKDDRRIDVQSKLREIFDIYAPKVELRVETETLLLKTATTSQELIEVFRMRQDIFAPISSDGKKTEFEFDEFDAVADHIIIIEKSSNKIIGTYRMLFSDNVDRFYSENEFNLDSFLSTPGGKLELGRACVREEFRSGATIGMLWRGLAHYADKVRPQYLFGCSSVHSTDKEIISQSFQYIKDNSYSDEFSIRPHDAYYCQYDANVSYDLGEIKKLVPPLLRTYFNCGAAVHGKPALDEEFHCVDFMTILNFENLNKSFWKRFFR